MLSVVIDANGVALACGETEAFVPPDGGRVVEVDADPIAALGAGEEAVYDGAAFIKRLRAETDDDRERKGALETLAQIDAAIDGWAGLTATQKANATLLALRAIRALARRVFR